VLASCETPTDVLEARAKGYATALVVKHFEDEKRHAVVQLDALPCVEQTKGVTCTDCRLCMKDDHLIASELTILFRTHSQNVKKANAALDKREAA
jgi:hypothetical protein